MTTRRDNDGVIAEATTILPLVVAALDPREQPVGGSWVAFTVRSDSGEGAGEGPIIHRCFYTWRHGSPLEPLEEPEYLDLTREPESRVIKVPVWMFELTPRRGEAWRFDYRFSAPLRTWYGDAAGDRVMSEGRTYVARRAGEAWILEFEDILLSDRSGPLAEDPIPVARPRGRPDYYQFRVSRVDCPACGWSGTGSQTAPGEAFTELFEYDCPRCGVRLGICSYPTVDEMRANWDRLSEHERRELEWIERVRDGGGDVENDGEMPWLDSDLSTAIPQPTESVCHRRPHPDLRDGVVVEELPDGDFVVPLLEEVVDPLRGTRILRKVEDHHWRSYTSPGEWKPSPPERRVAAGSWAWKIWLSYLAGERSVPLYDPADDLDDEGWALFGRAIGR